MSKVPCSQENVFTMQNKKEYEDYLLKRKALTKNKRVLVFRRNNLSCDDFERVDGTLLGLLRFDYV